MNGPRTVFAALVLYAVPAFAETIELEVFGKVKVIDSVDCTREGKGKYYILVHTGKTVKSNVTVRFPKGTKTVDLPAYGKTRTLENGTLSFKTLKPWQLLAIHRK